MVCPLCPSQVPQCPRRCKTSTLLTGEWWCTHIRAWMSGSDHEWDPDTESIARASEVEVQDVHK